MELELAKISRRFGYVGKLYINVNDFEKIYKLPTKNFWERNEKKIFFIVDGDENFCFDVVRAVDFMMQNMHFSPSTYCFHRLVRNFPREDFFIQRRCITGETRMFVRGVLCVPHNHYLDASTQQILDSGFVERKMKITGKNILGTKYFDIPKIS